MRATLTVVAVGLLLMAGCSSSESGSDAPATPEDDGLAISTDAFADGGIIPTRHTCDGEDLSPRIVLTGIPDGAVELALIVDDADAGGFVHWVAAAIPVTARELAEGEPPGQYTAGANDFGRTGYSGPCPPPGDGPHTYTFTLYVLEQAVDVAEGVSADELRAQMDDVTLGNAVTTGTYQR